MAKGKTSKTRKPKVTAAELEQTVANFGFALWPKHDLSGEKPRRVYDLCEPDNNGNPNFSRIVATGLAARDISIFLQGMECQKKRAAEVE